jgi:3-dehydroquinate dehydratase
MEMRMTNVLMLHGINHNMFGKRDPVQYGTITLAEIDARLQALGSELGVQVESFQTNSEAAMCDRIHRAFEEQQDAVLINAGAWTHYSYGIRDALATGGASKGRISITVIAAAFASNTVRALASSFIPSKSVLRLCTRKF